MYKPFYNSDCIRIGVSRCLLGHAVRFDGGHKKSSYLTNVLAHYFEFVPLCPEVAIGLGTPRQPIRLVGDPACPKALGVRDARLDVTGALARYGREIAASLAGISGYVFKRGSPSCGMERVKVYDHNAVPVAAGVGIYADALMDALPLLPVEDEGRLMDPGLRESFIQRVYVYNRWQRLVASGISPAALVRFHAAHKLIVLAHSEPLCRELGRLVARAGSEDFPALAELYIRKLMSALKQRATRKRHTNVLHHLAGFLKRNVDRNVKQELCHLIEAYRLGQVPLIVPVTLLAHYLRRFPAPYALRQQYLQPYPEALGLRNEI